jgi:hypothetical protein
MATILSFTPRNTAITRPPLAVEASVIIFPGVRYERPDDAAARGQKATAMAAPEPTAPRH